MRLEAYLGGFAVEIGERFILDLDLERFYGRVPWGRGGWASQRTWLNLALGRPCSE